MTTLPDVIHPPWETPVRLSPQALHLVTKILWRVAHPRSREPFVEHPRPVALSRVYYTSRDGWRSPLFHLPAKPGGAGEPVVLAHALGVGPDAFRYGRGPTLASALQRAGFNVYLLTHRGDSESVGPRRGTSSADGCGFDGIVRNDVPALLGRVREHSGFPAVHWVGHGLGGQLGLAWSGWSASEGLASVVAIGAPIRFEPSRSTSVRLARAAALLPAHWGLPTQAATRALAPWVAANGTSPPARVRGLLRYASEDVAAGLLDQVSRWMYEGRLVDSAGNFDYTIALSRATTPLLCVAVPGDVMAPLACATPAVRRRCSSPWTTSPVARWTRPPTTASRRATPA